MSDTTIRRLSLGALSILALSASGCGIVGPSGINCGGDFGVTDSARKLRAFLDATASFSMTATELDTTLRTECTALAMQLGATAAELAPSGSMTATQVACTRAAALIEQEMRAIRAVSGVTVVVETTTPECRVDVEAYNRCAATCDVRYMPGMAQVQCEGGELRGSCSAMCTGSCAVMASGMCSGACEGTCAGSCMGACRGTCEGTCSSRDATGACNGTCSGTCRGSCSAMCTGSCTGQCVAMASATCMGECRGACSVAFTEPRCTGRVVPPMVDADCRASCDTRFNARASCTPGQVAVRVMGSPGMLAERATRLTNALQGHYGAVLQVGKQLERLVVAGADVVTSGERLSGSVSSLGASAIACTANALNDVRLAVPKVQVSVSVSVSVTGSVAAR